MPASTFKVTVQEVRNDTPSVYSLIVKADQPVHFEPGQFFFIYLVKDGHKTAKAYSVASLPGQNTLEFCIKRVEHGFASNYLYHLKKGDHLEIAGPYGSFTLKPTDKPIIFLATGTGISALRPMIHTLFNTKAKQDIWLLFGVRTQQDIIYRKEFEQLAQSHTNFHFIPILSKEKWSGHHGHVQDVLWKVIKNPDAMYYVCGLFPMVDDTKKRLLLAGIPQERIHSERYV